MNQICQNLDVLCAATFLSTSVDFPLVASCINDFLVTHFCMLVSWGCPSGSSWTGWLKRHKFVVLMVRSLGGENQGCSSLGVPLL